MDFSSEYNRIISNINEDLVSFEDYFDSCLFDLENPVNSVLREYFSNKGKRIRSALIFILTRALGFDIKEPQYKLAFANEMIHNATLIHDDIVDDSSVRRDIQTLNAKYTDKLAVLTGDYLLSKALESLSSLENIEIYNIHTSSMLNIVNGELEQYFERYKPVSIEEYIEKSKNKTAELFKAGLCSAAVLCDVRAYYENIENFAINFGIAFQIHNDLKDIYSECEKSKEDLKNGIYTAPWIYYMEENNIDHNVAHNVKIMNDVEKSITELKNSQAVSKTQSLIDNYLDKAIENIAFLEDNQYKQAMVELCKLYRGLKSANR